MTSQLKDLHEPGPIAGAYEGLTRRAIALLDAPMAWRSPTGGRVKTNAISARSCGWFSVTIMTSSPPFSTSVCAIWRGVRSASIVPIQPSRTNCCKRGSTAVIALVLSATACWARGTPTGGASADNECIPGAPGVLDPQSVVPSSVIEGSGVSGPGGRLPTTSAAHVPRCASNASRCTCRKTVWSVAVQGVAWVKPRAWAIRAPSLRPHAARAL